MNRIRQLALNALSRSDDAAYKNRLIKTKQESAMQQIREAVDLAREVQEKHPDDYWANYNLALAYLYYWRPIDAWSYAINAIKIDRGCVSAYELLFNIASRMPFSPKLVEITVDIFNDALLKYPKLDLYREKDFYERQKIAIQKGISSILIITIPKSGTVYIRGKLSEALGLPFCQLTLAPFSNVPIPSWLESFAKGGAISIEHFSADEETVTLLERAGMTNIIVHVRDPREVALSMRHFLAKQSQYSGPIGTIAGDMYRASPDFESNYKQHCEMYIPWLMGWLKGWIECANDSNNIFNIKFTTYDDFLTNEEKYFNELLDFYSIDKSMFNQEKSVSDKHRTHFRSGKQGEWRTVVSEETKRYIWNLMDKEICNYFNWHE